MIQKVHIFITLLRFLITLIKNLFIHVEMFESINILYTTSQNILNEKYLSIIADARGKYNAAVKDGTLLSYYDIDKGLLELTKLRENINTKA